MLSCDCSRHTVICWWSSGLLRDWVRWHSPQLRLPCWRIYSDSTQLTALPTVLQSSPLHRYCTSAVLALQSSPLHRYCTSAVLALQSSPLHRYCTSAVLVLQSSPLHRYCTSAVLVPQSSPLLRYCTSAVLALAVCPSLCFSVHHVGEMTGWILLVFWHRCFLAPILRCCKEMRVSSGTFPKLWT